MLDAEVFSRLIALTKFSVSTDSQRPHLNSAFIEWEGNVVRMVSTDGLRLSKAEAAVTQRANVSLLIPLKAVAFIADLLEGVEDEIALVPSGASVFLRVGEAVFNAKLADAQFPPWRQVIPAVSGEGVCVNRVALLDAIRSVSIASERTHGVKLTIDDGRMVLKSESAEGGDGTDDIAVAYGGKKVAVGLNAQFVIDVLDALDSEEEILGVVGALDPFTIRPVQRESGNDYVGVIMPIRI